MHRLRVALPALGLVSLLTLSCTEEEKLRGPQPPGPTSSGTSAGGGGGGGGAPATGGAGGHFVTGGFGGQGLQPDLGELPLLEAPDTVCVPTAAPSSEVYPAGSNPNAFDRLEPLGADRWLATGTEFPTGFVTFAGDGSDASPMAVDIGKDWSFAASEGNTVALVGSQGASLLYQRYDAMDSSVGATVTVVGEPPAGVAIGGGGGEALVVWADGSDLRARGIGASGALAGPAFDVGPGTIEGSAASAIVHIDGGFAVVWTGHVGEEYATWFATVSTTAVLTAPVKTISATTKHEVVAIDAASWGYALVLAADVPTRTAVSMVIDDEGLVLGSAYKLLGTNDAFDVAVHGEGVGVTARRATGELEFRSLDFNANPVGPWICLDAPNTDIYSRAGVTAAGADGYAILYRTAQQGLALVEVDALGSPDR